MCAQKFNEEEDMWYRWESVRNCDDDFSAVERKSCFVTNPISNCNFLCLQKKSQNQISSNVSF